MASGRPVGAKNLTTREMKERAAHYGDTALLAIAKLMESNDERVVLDASRTLLERGYGKPAQIIEGNSDAPLLSINLGWLAGRAVSGSAHAPAIEHQAPPVEVDNAEL